MRRQTATALLGMAALLLLPGCGGEKTYADGTYEAQSSVYINEEEDSEDGNGYGVVTLTIEGGAITACEFKTYTTEDVLKDENYGKEGGEVKQRDYFNKAQKAVAACDEYAAQLVEGGSLKEVDAISGATVNYNEFKEAVKAALKEAEE